MKNRLATHLTTWKTWYFVLGLVAFLIGSQIGLVGQLVPALAALAAPLTFVVFTVLALVLMRLFSRRWPTAEDLALKPGLRLWEIGLIVVVFAISHLIFAMLSWGQPNLTPADELFIDSGFGEGLPMAFALLFSSVILAPVCEEILYRGVILRSVHDGLIRRIPRLAAVVIALAVSSIVFALPHLGDSLVGRLAVAYLVTSLAFGIVYVVTGSLTAAMVSHSLQSCFSFLQIMIYGRGDHDVPVVLWILVITCPLLVFLVAKGLYAILPKSADRDHPVEQEQTSHP